MIYFLLPSSPKHIYQRIKISKTSTEPVCAISQSLCKYMNEIKEKIASREKEWDVYKKCTNPYEYIHSVIPHKKRAVSKYKPISRSYFKMVEMITTFHLDVPVEEYIIPPPPPPGFDNVLCSRKRNTSTQSSAATEGGLSLPKPRSLDDLRTQSFYLRDSFRSAPENNEVVPTQRSDARNSGTFLLTHEDESSPFTSLNNVGTLRTPILPQSRAGLAPISTRNTLLQQSSSDDSMRTFHLAEGPGGFIEALCKTRNNPSDKYHGMTILVDETDDNVPGWNKTSHFLEQYPNVHIETGEDETGNILRIANFDHCVNKYASSMDLVTADGGFDFSKDFNKQELSIMNLLWGRICYALCLQKKGGNFVLKIFDVFYDHTIDMMYILSGFYNEVNVCKLQTSRIGNSEKYVVCKGFRYETCGEFLPILRESFSQLLAKTNVDANHAYRLLNTRVPRHFTKRIEDVNALFGQQQIENIHYTISIIDKHGKYDKTEQLTKQNIAKCVNWCIEHKIPYNNITTTNIFIGAENSYS